MLELFFVTFAGGLQWLSIWAGVSKINKKETKKREITFKQTFCTMGLPAILGVLITLILLFTPVPTYFGNIAHIVLSVLFAFNGIKLYNKLFVKKPVKKNNKNTKKVKAKA